MSIEGGEETEVIRGPVEFYADWALSQAGLYYTMTRRQSRREEYSIHFLDFESGQTTELFRREGLFEHRWLVVSPDEEWILFVEDPVWPSELMLVENFR